MAKERKLSLDARVQRSRVSFKEGSPQSRMTSGTGHQTVWSARLVDRGGERNGAYRHGHRTQEAMAERKMLRASIRASLALDAGLELLGEACPVAEEARRRGYLDRAGWRWPCRSR